MSTGEREVLTEGKLLLLGCENNALQGYGLHSRKKVGTINVILLRTGAKKKKKICKISSRNTCMYALVHFFLCYF